jgi:hypothetical protein
MARNTERKMNVAYGSFASFRPRANDFRFTPINRHSQGASAGLKCASTGSDMHWRCPRRSPPVHAGGLQGPSSSIGWGGFPFHAAD